MMENLNMDLEKILNLVGTLQDSDDENSASSRFRNLFVNEISNVSTMRNYIQECLENKSPQFNRALQDLVNRIGELLGFDVTYGRYKGVQGEIGYDGLWESTSGKFFIVETKTTNAYTIKTTQVLNYKNELVSGNLTKDKNSILGLYVIGRKDTEANQLKNSIVAENREKELRLMSIQSLLELLKIKEEYGVSHENILSIFLPSGPEIDPYINLVSALLSQEKHQKMRKTKQPQKENEREHEEHQDEIKDYSGRNIIAYTFKGNRKKVDQWIALLKKLCIDVSEDKPEQFDSVLEIKGRKRYYFSRNPEELFSSSKEDINGTGIYFETNLGSNSIVKICKRIHYPEDIFEVEVQPDRFDEP